MASLLRTHSPPLPRIACFHGGGSNGLVFAFQCARLQHMFAHEYEFVFFDAPFEWQAGPGVLPYFSNLAPFRTWIRPEFLEDDERKAVKSVVQLMQENTLSRSEGAKKVGKWIGAMGFSQGTRVVGGLLRWMETVHHDDQNATYQDIDIQFGVLCMGSSGPLGYNLDSSYSLLTLCCPLTLFIF
jgi:predicted esterase